jgi:hypothetical protein
MRFLLIFFSIFLFSCVNTSHFTIKKTVPSPDGQFFAICFLHNGDATTSYRPQVAIVRKNERFRYTNGKVFSGYRAKYINAFWKDNSTLIILHNCLEKYIFMQLDEYNGIKIEYIVITSETADTEDITDFENYDYFRQEY